MSSKTTIMRRIFLTLPLLFVCCVGFTQETNTHLFSDVRFGAKAGLNISNQFGDVNGARVPRFDAHAGVISKMPLFEGWDVLLEAIYSREGYKFKEGGLQEGTELQGFLNLNGLASRDITPKISAEAGMSLAVKLHETAGEIGRNRYKRIWFGITAGGTYRLMEQWWLQGRLTYKPEDLIRDEAPDNEGTSSLMFQLSVVYLFN